MHDKNTGMDAVSHNADHAERKTAMQERFRMPLQCGLYAIGYDRTTDGAECGSRGVSAQKKAGLVEINHYTTSDAQVYARGVQI
jgi:pyruvate/2-oxoglutarate dehydrogenase complex dihydrolipoamide dehydrogenase (E3) component